MLTVGDMDVTYEPVPRSPAGYLLFYSSRSRMGLYGARTANWAYEMPVFEPSDCTSPSPCIGAVEEFLPMTIAPTDSLRSENRQYSVTYLVKGLHYGHHCDQMKTTDMSSEKYQIYIYCPAVGVLNMKLYEKSKLVNELQLMSATGFLYADRRPSSAG